MYIPQKQPPVTGTAPARHRFAGNKVCCFLILAMGWVPNSTSAQDFGPSAAVTPATSTNAVPLPATLPAATHATGYTLTMKDGSVLVGEITNETLTFNGTYAVATLKPVDVQSYSEGALHLADQTILKGIFAKSTITLKNVTGVFELPAQEVVKILGPAAPPSEPSTGAPNPPPAAANALPQSYGCYALVDDKMVGLTTSPITTCMGLTMGGNGAARGVGVDGYAGAAQKLSDPVKTIIVYLHDVDPNQLVLATLGYVDSMTAGEFNIAGTNPTFFASIYGVNSGDTVKVNLWRSQTNVPMQIAPIDDHKDMYKLTSQTELASGMYSLSFTGALHPMDNIFTTTPGRTGAGYFFQIPVPRKKGGSIPTLGKKNSNASSDIQRGIPISFMPGYVQSPYIQAAPIDVRGYVAGTQVRCPYTNKIFIVPKMDGN